MIILTSRFVERKLKEIEQVNKSLASLKEMLVITKQQRQLVEGWLPKIECSNNYRRYQEEFEHLMLKERFLCKEIDRETLKVLIELDKEKEAHDASLVLNLS